MKIFGHVERKKHVKIGVNSVNPNQGEVKYCWGHPQGLPGGGGLAAILETSAGSRCPSSTRTFCLQLKRTVWDIGRSRDQEFWLRVLDRGSGLFSASNLLRSWTMPSAFSPEKTGRPGSTLLALHSERERRKHTSNSQQTCQRVKYFGSGDENNSN